MRVKGLELIRKNVTFYRGFEVRIERLKKKRGLSSDSEVMRDGVIVLDIITEHVEAGFEVIFRKKETGEEKVLLTHFPL